MVTSAVFWDRAAEKYAKSTIKDMDAYTQTLDRVRGFLKPEDRVLEIGGGTGMTAALLAPSVTHLLSTDISPAMIEIANRRKADEGVQGLDFGVGTAFDGDHIGQTFDAVLSFNFIHLAEDPQAMIEAAYKLTKPGGLFISKSACMGDWIRAIRPVIWIMQKIGKAPHLSYFGRDGLDQMMRNAGFEVIDTHEFSKSPPSRFIVTRRP